MHKSRTVNKTQLIIAAREPYLPFGCQNGLSWRSPDGNGKST